MGSRQMFGIAMLVVGAIMVLRGFFAQYLYNDTEEPIPESQIKKYAARPKDRISAVSVGIGCIALGVVNLVR